MKRKKNKLSDKLDSLKEGITLPDSDNLLDEEIPFESEDKTQMTSEEEVYDDAAENSMPMENTEASEVASTRVMIQGEATSVIPSEDSDENSGSQTYSSPSDAEGSNDESTFRDVNVGREGPTEKVSYGDVYEPEDTSGEGSQSVGGMLKHVEHLRLAQDKINDLEAEIEELRRENDDLLSAADTFKVLSEDYYEQMDRLKVEVAESRETGLQENRIIKDSLLEREKQVNELKQINADLKSKVETNFKQIRKRERDLEYRLEMAKVEEATLLKSKDKSILELRRKIDKLEQEMEAYRDKNKEHYEKLQRQQQTVRGVVRALRIALTRLEGDFGVDFEVLKKAE
jgi:hypothetical protein